MQFAWTFKESEKVRPTRLNHLQVQRKEENQLGPIELADNERGFAFLLIVCCFFVVWFLCLYVVLS